MIYLKSDYLLSPISSMWENYRLENATTWPDRYIHQMCNYNKRSRSHGGIIIEDFDTREQKL
jgi:hypothetical protein